MSTKEVAKSTCDQVQRKSDLVKIEDPESDPIENSSKRRKTSVGLWRDNDVGMAGNRGCTHGGADMVDMLKFGKEPLHKELMALEESLVPLKLTVEWRWKKIMKAHDQWREAQFEYNNATDVRDKIAQEMVKKFGGEYDRVLKGHLGFGMLPEY
ncbi:hypothetical protein L2E82_27919 [Cichorium intybus]|uniref:Uncharacterized protein n=1 Tax=Cichorium intybus TaxID=13427 RepID=A0ACB9CUC8_CICIN|nr:hypothetical protein L2E82_27919 [Cichorium intybus]